MIEKTKDWFSRKAFELKTGIPINLANDGKPIEQVVIGWNDFYFSIDIDHESGEPTGGFGWSRDPTVFQVPLREQYKAVRKEQS